MTRLFAILFLVGAGAGSAYAQSCPVAIPAPASAHDCECKTLAKPIGERCAAPLPPDQCRTLIADAFARQLLTADARDWLTVHGFCPVFIAGVTGILDFCPVGCFAADTQILTDLSGDGTASFTAAADLLPQKPLMALSDEASFDAVDLVSRRVQRVVYGPEVAPLFVFTLGNGATLRVTEHHPMVLDNGAIVEAAAVKPESSFIGIDGQTVAITAITREPATADVFNFETDGDTQLGHVVSAARVLTGDLKLQNELAAEQHSIELRQ